MGLINRKHTAKDESKVQDPPDWQADPNLIGTNEGRSKRKVSKI
jgi:hypothetical protein